MCVQIKSTNPIHGTYDIRRFDDEMCSNISDKNQPQSVQNEHIYTHLRYIHTWMRIYKSSDQGL